MVTEDAAVTPMKTSQPEQEWDINDKYLRLKKKSIRKLITLPPKYMGNLNKGIEEAIFKSSQEIYNEFNGVPISMGKKTLLQNVGTTLDDHPYIQFYVDLECVVFTPKIDKKVRAIVNKVGDTFIGCLICGKINATVFKRGKRPDADSGSVTSEQQILENTINSIKIGDQILIKIKTIQYDHNNLSLVGVFVDLLSQIK